MKREKERGTCSGKANRESCVMFKYESVSVLKRGLVTPKLL